MKKDLTYRNPVFEGFRKCFQPLTEGLTKGMLWGALMGVVTWAVFGAADLGWQATLGGGTSLFAEGSALGAMQSFVTLPVQVVFNSVVNGAIRGVQAGRDAFVSGYRQAKSYNDLLDRIEEQQQEQGVSKTQYIEVIKNAPSPAKYVQAILEQGPSESHHDAAKRMADLVVEESAAR